MRNENDINPNVPLENGGKVDVITTSSTGAAYDARLKRVLKEQWQKEMKNAPAKHYNEMNGIGAPSVSFSGLNDKPFKDRVKIIDIQFHERFMRNSIGSPRDPPSTFDQED